MEVGDVKGRGQAGVWERAHVVACWCYWGVGGPNNGALGQEWATCL